MELSTHAKERARARGISREDIELVVEYGRHYYARGAKIWFLGRRDVKQGTREDVRLRDLVGIHLVCSGDGSTIVTTYRNKNRTSPVPRPGRKRRADYTEDRRRYISATDHRPTHRYAGWNIA